MSEPGNANEEDFAALFAASVQSKRIENGQSVEGTVVAIGADSAFVNIGAKGEATIALDELRDDDGALEVAVGDRIHATVVSTTGGVTLSRKLQRRAATAGQLEAAFRTGLPIEGKVEAEVKGGYTVTVARQRAFCPFSQMDTVRAADPATYLGHTFTFRIIEYTDGGRRFVVSRRVLLEAEQQARAAEVRQSIVVGAVLSGRVVSVRDFGAFVDLGGGVQGLLHVSEMGWTHVSNPNEVVATGQPITVKVLKIDGEKIALGLRQLLADPWSAVPATFQPGQVHRGRIARIADFGLFVELAPGIVGLVPASETGLARETALARAFAIGADVDVVVLDVDEPARRIRLSIKAITTAEEAADVREYAERDGVDRSSAFGGSLADKLRGALTPRG